MIEETLYKYLKQASVPWSAMRTPTTESNKEISKTKYGLFEKTSSRKSEHVVYSTFAFQSYAPTLAEAAQVSAELRELMEQLPFHSDEVTKTQLNNEYNFTADKQPRYQAVFSIVHYENF